MQPRIFHRFLSVRRLKHRVLPTQHPDDHQADARLIIGDDPRPTDPVGARQVVQVAIDLHVPRMFQPEAALAGIRQVVAEAVADMAAAGEVLPAPLAEKHYSGEFRVRIPPEVHRALAMQAAEQGIRLNRLASAKLAA